MKRFCGILMTVFLFVSLSPEFSRAWHDETHIAVAKVAGYYKWFNACGADMAKLKAGSLEAHNHQVNKLQGTVVTPEMVLAQVEKYNTVDEDGHLYGATIASIRDHIQDKRRGNYGEYHLAFCAHYVADLSMPTPQALATSSTESVWQAKELVEPIIAITFGSVFNDQE